MATRARLVLLVSLVLVTGCRKGTSGSGAATQPIGLPSVGVAGCEGGNLIFAPTPPLVVAAAPVGATLTIGPASHLTADPSTSTLYVTGAGATLVELDYSVPGPPIGNELVSAGTVQALLAASGITTPAPELAGLAVYDAGFLVVVELTSNTLLLVNRLAPDEVDFFVGLPDDDGGFADGVLGGIRFNFDRATDLVVSGDGRLFVADPGNHAVRVITLLAFPEANTITGTGAPGFGDGPLTISSFDTPIGLRVDCLGQLLVLEAGDAGVGGHRLRSLSVGGLDALFGGFIGDTLTAVGDGTNASAEGIGEAAQVARPTGLLSTANDELYWIDSSTGTFRRQVLGTGMVDCPLDVDCASAAGDFSATGGVFSMASLEVSGSTLLFIVDADAGALLQLGP